MSATMGVVEVVTSWATGRFKSAIPFLGQLLALEPARQTISASLTLDEADPVVKKVSALLGFTKASNALFYSSEHFTHIQVQRVEDQLTQNGGVAHLLELNQGSVWVWHPNPRYTPLINDAHYKVLLTRVMQGSDFSTTFHNAFADRMNRFQEFKAFLNTNARPY